MGELKFQKLTPTQDVDLSGYEEAFHYIFAEDDIRNIAISGAYSSGKSSVIESYKKKHPEKKFMHLSLAHFQALDESSENESADSDLDEDHDDTESVIEGKILNQLIQQIPAEKIPQTNFRIKRSLGAKKPVLASFMICVFIALCLHCIKFNDWGSTVTGLRDGLLKSNLLVTTQPEARIVSIGLILIMLGIAVFNLIKLQHSKNFLRKVSVQGNEIEIFADNNNSYFDKYLNEVLYLFENTGVDGVVFEDIDRFDNHTIFERLREINTLTNIRLQNRKGKTVRKPLRFFYLLRDDIFENKDRTKFFDYIMPVVPVLDSSNSYNKIKEYLESAGLYSEFDDHFLRGVALYIDDLRIVKNIFNEFLIYNQKLNSIELDVNKLFAIIVYKNIFPKDFADLQLNQGFVHTLFESRDRLIANRIATANEAITELEEQISRCEKEHLENQAELDIVRESKENTANRYGSWSQKYRDYQEWNKNVYSKRKQALEDRKEENISELRRLVEQKKEEKSKIENMQLAALLDRQNTDDAFRVDYINEIERVEHFYTIKGNPYFPLLKYLVSRGYIDESYSDYMTFFYPNSISLRDKVFLRAVADRTCKQASYELDSPALVTENLNEYDFSQPETLNYALSEYILVEGKADYIRSMILQLASDECFEYITGYLRSDKKSVPMVEAIVLYWPEMFHDAWSSHKMSDDLLKTISYLMLNIVPVEQLEKVNIDDCLREFVSGDPYYLCVNDVDAQKVGSTFEVLQVMFDEIKTDGINAELFDYVYDHNLYTINKANILLMLREKFSDENIDFVLPRFFTFILEQKECPLCGYLWESKPSTLSVYLDMYDNGIKDSCDTIVELLNSDEIVEEEKKAYITRLETQIEKIESITDLASQKMIVVNHKANYSTENILYYFGHFGLTEELISFINSGSVALDYMESTDDGVIDKFLKACIQEESIDDTKYREIMGNICDQMSAFSIDGLSENKLNILVDLDLIEMNIENLKFIRTTYPDVVFTFIRHDFEKYITIAVGKYFELSEAVKILEWTDISDEKKIELLGQTTASIEVQNKPYSDRLLIYILRNNLYEGDLTWILSEYSSFSVDVQSTVLQIAINQLARIASNYADRIDKTLLGLLYKSENADFTEKLQLLENTAKGMSKYQLCAILNDLGADKITDNINGGRRKVKSTDENDEILEALYNAGVIYKPEHTNDGQNYKPIKYKKWAANFSLPASLL